MRVSRKCLHFSLILLTCLVSATAQTKPVDLQLRLRTPFSFVAYGDTRFTDPTDTQAANAEVRRTLVNAIAEANPAFISIGGDIAYSGDQAADWKVWDSETEIWRQRGIPVLPVLGNHDLKNNQAAALKNYFERFPQLKESRYYSMRAANILMLVLDSSQDEVSGQQGEWLVAKMDNVPGDVDFVIVVLHHPPYSSSSDSKAYGGGHTSRTAEHKLAEFLEQRQQSMRSRIVVFSGHVHNYERHEHGGVSYFVTGGGGAHAYPIERAPGDPFQSKDVNYHYLLVEVAPKKLTVTMDRLELKDGKPSWTKADNVAIVAPDAAGAVHARSDRGSDVLP
jgi:Icc-related predicted phosphoesterase